MLAYPFLLTEFTSGLGHLFDGFVSSIQNYAVKVYVFLPFCKGWQLS